MRPAFPDEDAMGSTTRLGGIDLALAGIAVDPNLAHTASAPLS